MHVEFNEAKTGLLINYPAEVQPLSVFKFNNHHITCTCLIHHVCMVVAYSRVWIILFT